MMGLSGGNQNSLFYSFNLEAHVPANHLLRGRLALIKAFM